MGTIQQTNSVYNRGATEHTLRLLARLLISTSQGHGTNAHYRMQVSQTLDLVDAGA
jgi:hypothetical protein